MRMSVIGLDVTVSTWVKDTEEALQRRAWNWRRPYMRASPWHSMCHRKPTRETTLDALPRARTSHPELADAIRGSRYWGPGGFMIIVEIMKTERRTGRVQWQLADGGVPRQAELDWRSTKSGALVSNLYPSYEHFVCAVVGDRE